MGRVIIQQIIDSREYLVAMKLSKGGHVTTIFHSMMHQKDKGTIWELALWIIVCVASLIALLAGILVDGEMSYLGGIQICWILLFFSAIGYGVLLLLQLRVWSVLYGITVYPLLFLIFYYLCENKLTYLFLGSDKPVGSNSSFYYGIFNRNRVSGLCHDTYFFATVSFAKSHHDFIYRYYGIGVFAKHWQLCVYQT